MITLSKGGIDFFGLRWSINAEGYNEISMQHLLPLRPHIFQRCPYIPGTGTGLNCLQSRPGPSRKYVEDYGLKNVAVTNPYCCIPQEVFVRRMGTKSPQKCFIAWYSQSLNIVFSVGKSNENFTVSVYRPEM